MLYLAEVKSTETPAKVEEPTPAAVPVAPAVAEPEVAKTEAPAPIEPAKTEAARMFPADTR